MCVAARTHLQDGQREGGHLDRGREEVRGSVGEGESVNVSVCVLSVPLADAQGLGARGPALPMCWCLC